MDAAESKAILGQTLTSGEGQHGTQALGQVHNEVRLDILKSDARRIAGTLTAQLVAPLVILNIPGADPKRLPRFTIDVPEPEDLALYADALPKLAAAGMKIGVKDMHRRLRIPEAEDGEDLLRGPAAAPAAAAGASDAPPAAKAAKDANAAKDKKAALAGEVAPAAARDALDDLVDEALADWELMLAPIVEPLLAEMDKAIAAGESLDSLRARLPELLAHMDARPMAERLARAAFMARLAGAADIDLFADPQEQA
jgi:phage gp29-like protein